jgi:HEPN domain-containing protein
LAVTKTLRTPVNFIVHTLQEVNDGLAHGRYFFMDVRSDGIALYEDEDTELHEPKPKTPAQALVMVKEYFEDWFRRANSGYNGFKFFLDEREWNDAAFLLHQTVERMYHCVLLVSTFYTPHVHNLAFLRIQAERLDKRLVYVWPSATRAERARFEKLKEAYVKARYSKHYQINEEELAWLGTQVEELGRVVHAICAERISELENKADS